MTITITEDQHKPFAELLYRAVFRREPDVAGLANLLQLLANGMSITELLSGAVGSAEFLGSRLVPASVAVGGGYDPEADAHIASYATPDVRARSEALRLATPIPRAEFDAVVAEAARRFQAELPAFGHQEGYLEVHRERFYELANLASVLLGECRSAEPQLLDIGFSINTVILQALFPTVPVSVSDRFGGVLPPSVRGGSYPADLASSALDTLDLGIRADVILFAEVLEHLLANPVRVMRFLIRHLAEGGRMVLTTPNFFRRELLDAILWGINPQPILPIDMDDDTAHFHVREYGMKELLDYTVQAGGRVEAFFYSPCWDSAANRETLPQHEWSNMVLVIARA